MNRPRPFRLIVIASLAALTAACASTPSAHPRESGYPMPLRPTPPASFTALSGQEATTISRSALTIMWSYDAADPADARQGQRAAYLRASRYLTPAYLHQITTTMPASPLPAVLVDHRARSSTTLKLLPNESGEADTILDAARTWRLTTTPHGRDGWKGHRTTVYLYVTLTRPNPFQPWKIASISVH